MFVIVVYKFFQRIFQSRTSTKFIIDWHNYGYSIMRANKVSAPLCILGKIYEGYFGTFGDYHLTVSKAFKTDLHQKFKIPLEKISVLYDRAVSGKFKKLNQQQKYALFDKIGLQNVFLKKQGEQIIEV